MTELAEPTITVKFAGSDDAPRLAVLFKAMYQEWGSEPPSDDTDITSSLVQAIADQRQCEILIAVIEDECIGFAVFGEVFEPAFMGMGGFLRDVFVHPGFRRRGVGSALMHRLFAEAGNRVWVSLDWHVNRLDFDARTFFEIQAPDGYNVDRLVHRIEGETLAKLAHSTKV